MKFIVVWVVLLTLAPVLSVFGEDGHDDNEIILQLAAGVSIDTINARYDTSTDDVLLNGSVYKVEVSDSANLDATVAAMQKDPDIKKVEFN